MHTEQKNIENAINLINKSKFEDAINLLEFETKKNSQDFRAYYLLGTCYLEVKNLDLAEKNLKYSVNLNNKMSSSIHNLGIVLSLRKKFSEATKYFLKALELDPNNIETLIELGRNYELSKNFIDAEHAYKKAIKLETNNKIANGLLGRMLINIGFHRSGISYLRKSTGLIRLKDDSFKII